MDENDDDFEETYVEELRLLRELEAQSPSSRPNERAAKRPRIHQEAEEEKRGMFLAQCVKKAKMDVVARRKKVWKRIPPGNFVAVTCPETKRRVYLNVRSENLFSKPQFEVRVAIEQLGSTPFEILRQESEELRRRSRTRERAAAAAANDEKMATDLWVDQFRPKNYIDLLSDDGINRNLLRWLKLWDKVVFDRERKPKQQQQQQQQQRQQRQAASKRKFANQVVEELDHLGYPAQRVALLCGPPGLGKTTLAHVIASHAGYNVVELNASDDRSPEQFRRQIESSTQMMSTKMLDPRPNCLVMDEIDGAPVASINLLIAMTTAKEKKKGGKKASNGLRRPVICICNNQYVPALRQLRQSALVLTFPTIASSRLAFRLQDILNLQKYALDLSTLLALCKKTENDVRSCLGTLQFVFGRSKSKLVTLSSILSSAVGVKDEQKSLFTFFHRMVRDARANGDYDKIYQGVFHNYLTAKNQRLNGFCQVTRWFEFIDSIQTRTYESQSFVLQSYLPLACAYFRTQLSSNSPANIEYPSAQAEARSKTLACQNVLETLNQDRPARVRSMCGRGPLLLDVLPYLSIILRPPLRPLNTRLLSAHERDELKSLVALMVELNLNLVQKRSVEGQYSVEMEPNIDELVRFPFNWQHKHRDLSYAAKQLVAREIELEKVRRGERKMEEMIKPVVVAEKKLLFEERTNLVSVDFFGRSVAAGVCPSPSNIREGDPSSLFRHSDIWFRFKEGYSNAVRRSVRISDLLVIFLLRLLSINFLVNLMLLVVLVVVFVASLQLFVVAARSSIVDPKERGNGAECWSRDSQTAKECIQNVRSKARRSQVMCTFCEFVLLKIDEELAENKSEDKIKRVVLNVCLSLPQAMSNQCKTFIAMYGEAIVGVIAYEVDPSVVCNALGICTD
uniref:Saposin B-type domain-containing protein n=1 Tax=Strigamia maritima TaxID=126957 RepID=T1INU3_STRMM